MAPKKQLSGDSKKAQGQARKADKAAAKVSAENAKRAAVEDEEWNKGSKDSGKKEAAEAKKREAAQRKAAAAAALAAEEASQPSKPKNRSKAPEKRTRGGSVGGSVDGALAALNASGIDDALDALSLTTDAAAGGGGHGHGGGVDRHPERRVKAAYAAFEERRLPEVREEHKGLRLNQMKELLRKEFERSPENPYNQAGVVGYDATKEEIEEAKRKEKERIEARLTVN